MKKTLRCPKCQHNRILFLSQIPDADGPQRAKTFGLARAPGNYIVGVVNAYVCRACGYTEFYAYDPDSIPVDGDVVREIVGPGSGGPFR